MVVEGENYGSRSGKYASRKVVVQASKALHATEREEKQTGSAAQQPAEPSKATEGQRKGRRRKP